MMALVTCSPSPDTSEPDRPPAAEAADVADRDERLSELASLTLPLMWTLRQASVRALEPLGLRPIQGLVVGLIAQGVASPKTIADLLDLAPSMVSGLLGDLEERGLIVRRPDPDDRRRIHLALSDAGLEATDRISERWIDVTRERLGDLNDRDLDALIRIYRSLLGSG